MLDKIKQILALIAIPFGKVWNVIVKIFYKIFPRRASKYFDADRHEVKYVMLMAAGAVVINLYMEWFARFTTGPFEGFKWAASHPVVFLYNALIIFCTMTFALLFRRRRFVWFIVSLLWVVIGTVNGVILMSRMTPFTLYDLQNFADGLTIATTYFASWQLVLVVAAAVLGVIAILMIFLRSEKWKNIRYPKSIAAILITVAVTLGASYGAIHAGIVGTFFGNLNYAYRDYGLAYCFIETSANAGISRPRGYSEAMIQSILENKTKKGTDTILEQKDDSTEHPNIIVLQMESFTVAQDYANIQVDRDPTPVFNELYDNYTSGRFIVPACGAGTANTEFEVLTGISAKFFGPGEYPYKGKLRKKTLENMAYVAKSHGYATSALHDHRALFYNRNEVYANLGFDTFTSVEYMNNVSFTPTNWCKDTVLTDEIMDIMKSTDQRDFLHVISVEGHGAYPTEQVFKNPYTTVTAEDETTKWRYEYYLNECHEMDTFIGELIEAINEAEEPTVMIIYGDHIPALDVKEENYKADDLYQTRYVIWDNIGLEKKDRDLHSYQSGAVLLKDAGLAHEGIMFDYQQTTKSKDPAYLAEMEALAYDMLYGKLYAFGGTAPYQASNMQMGHKLISIKDIIKIGDRYYIRGKNFTERSIISLEGKQLSTVYLSPTLLALNEEIDPEDVSKLEVSQVDKSEEEILTTVGANEEL
ncbi:MAG: LTA synthase family protein [Mogibacterium sp.]|nr:LTA synthase family protein [Mogibacterium sp.]MBR2539936.1 LTA synthase family protein [Mogibacterium sp.]